MVYVEIIGKLVPSARVSARVTDRKVESSD